MIKFQTLPSSRYQAYRPNTPYFPEKLSCKYGASCPPVNATMDMTVIISILKRKSFATLTKMLVPFFGPKQSLSDNAIDKFLYLPCIQHKNQNDVAYGCRVATIFLRQPPILKSHGYNTSHVMRATPVAEWVRSLYYSALNHSIISPLCLV